MESQEKLPAEFKAKWVEALRSGNYKQGKELLFKKSNNTYCCLGVACVVAGAKIDDGNIRLLIREYPPIEGVGKVPAVLKGGTQEAMTLANMNDNGLTFLEIADYIEQKL